MPSELNLSSLKPAQKRVARKRVGRGMGSGKGRYAGRGIKGQKSRSGSHKMRGRLRGRSDAALHAARQATGHTSKDAMPVGPFRTQSQGVNVRDLERVFDAGAEVTPEALKAKRLIRTTRIDVKILGQGELTKKLTVSAHGVSQSAREKIEGAGGSVMLLREPKERKRKRHKKASQARRGRDAGRRGVGRAPGAAEAGARSRSRARVRRGIAGRAVLADERMARAGATSPPAVHGDDHRAVPARLLGAGARRRLGADPELLLERRAAPCSACSTSSREARSRSSRSSRWGSCRTSRRRSSSSC